MKNVFLCLTALFLLYNTANAQCTYQSVSFDSFEYNTTIPHLQTGVVYHTTPKSYKPAHTGTRYLYMNFINGVSPNTLIYDRPYNVCPNQTYKISAWFNEINNGTSNYTLRIRDANNTILVTSAQTNSTSSWVQWTSASFSATTSTIRFQLVYTGGVGNNDLAMDDLELSLCKDSPYESDTLFICSQIPNFNLLDSLSLPFGNTGLWSGPSTLGNASLGTFNPSQSLPGKYIYTIAGSPTICPDSVGHIYIDTKQGPIITLDEDTTLCFGEQLLLNAHYPNATYLWQDQSVDSTFMVTQAGKYRVQVSVNGCVSNDSIEVNYHPQELVNLGKDSNYCYVDAILLNAIYPGASYLWSDQSDSGIFTVNNPGIYWVTLTVGNCTDTDTIEITENIRPTFNLGPDTAICDHLLPYFLDATVPNATYYWQDGSTDPTFTVTEPGSYWLLITEEGCTYGDTVEIKPKSCRVILEIPNVFTPNGDGLNDVFHAVAQVLVEDLDFKIFNRWGGIVYQAKNNEIAWDGTGKNGAEQAGGVYFWVAAYPDKDGVLQSQRGAVTLMR